MELLLILTYTAICVAVFKIFRIPVNKWTLPTAALGGIFVVFDYVQDAFNGQSNVLFAGWGLLAIALLSVPGIALVLSGLS